MTNDIPRTLIVGADGLVGRHLLAAYRNIDSDTLGTTRRRERLQTTDALNRKRLAYLDLAEPDLDAALAGGGEYQQAIITAAAAKVDQCRLDPEGTRRVNVTGTLSLIDQLRRRGILPIFLSSDYVFDGTLPGGYPDDFPLCPNTEYGQQKARVEEALRQSGRPYLVLRLSKTYGLDRGFGSMLDEIAGQLMSGRPFAAAIDQVFSPTFAGDLAPAIMEVQKRGLLGVMNLCAPIHWNRHDIALAVAWHLGASSDLVQRVSLDDLTGIGKRPKSTALIPGRLMREIDVRFTTIEEALPRLARQWYITGRAANGINSVLRFD